MGSLVVITILFAVASFGAAWGAKKLASRGQALATAAEVPVSQLAEDAAAVAQELGAGSFRQAVKLRGRVSCDAPLVSELSHTLCASYKFSVTREFEEALWETDAQGNSVQRMVRKSEVVASNDVSAAFWLDDGTSKIVVQPDDAQIERTKTHSNFHPVGTAGPQFRVGSFVLNLPAHPGGTLGYRYEEWCLPLGTEVTVVGEAGDRGGQLAVRRPEAKESPFVVSPRSFQELARTNQTLVTLLRGASVGLALVAVLIFVVGVIR